MSNSPLVDYIRLSPNCNRRGLTPIRKITIHHTAGVASVEGMGATFAPASRQGSANYGIGFDGRVGMYVEECNRAWTSSNAENDFQAVTIEVSNDSTGGVWHVSDVCLGKLVDLCVDICRRNGIERLNFTGEASGNLTMHKWFAPTACPGEYLESKFPWIAEEVNKRLEEEEAMTDTEKKEFAALKAEVENLAKENKRLQDKIGTVSGENADLKKRLDHYDDMGVYDNAAVKWAYIDGNLPNWAKPTIKKLVNKGLLKGGDKNSLELSRLMIRILVILDRAGTFG